MRCRVEDTITPTTKEATITIEVTITTRVRTITMVRRIGIKNSKGSYQKKEDKKESKDKDVYLTLTKDIKFRCPAGFDENIFACTCKMIQEKVDSTRQAGVTDIKTINTVEKDNFMRVFNFPEDVYDSAWAQATGEEDPTSSGDTSD